MDYRHLDPIPSYEITPNPPAVMSWEEYERRSTEQLESLLNRDVMCGAGEIREFLAKNPCWVPAASGSAKLSDDAPFATSFESPFAHSRKVATPTRAPFAWAVLFQSPLREWSRARDRYVTAEAVKVPDFLWLTENKDGLEPVLIDVGTPMDVWLTEVGRWRSWFSRLESRIAFCADFGIPRAYKNVNPTFLLVDGRRGASARTDEGTVMTFDDLKPDRASAPYICATKRSAVFEAVWISPMLRLGPASAVELCRIRGLAEAVAKNDWISPERREFLIERLPFWTRWPGMPKRLPERLSWDDWE